MDFLDQPTHSLILNDLAACLARDALAGRVTERDLAFLRRGETSASAGTLGQAALRNVMAQAHFAAAAADAIAKDTATLPEPATRFFNQVVDDLLSLLPTLPDVTFDESIIQHEQWAVPDELVYTIIEALLKIATARPDTQTRIHAAIGKLVTSISAQLRGNASPHDVAVKHTPLLHGVARVLQDVAYPWTAEAYAQVASPFVTLAIDLGAQQRLSAQLICLPGQEAAAAQCIGSSGALPPEERTESAYRDNLLEAYLSAGAPLSGPFVQWCALSSIVSVLGRMLVSSAGEAVGSYADIFRVLSHTSPPSAAIDTQLVLRVALASYEDIARIVRNESELYTELFASEILSSALRLAALAQAATNSDAVEPGDGAAAQLFASVLGHESPLPELPVFRAALECIAVLAQARSVLAPQLTENVCTFSALPIVSDIPDVQPVAAAALSACVNASGRDELAEQSVYNLLSTADGKNGSGGISVATKFTLLHNRAEFTALVASLLQQQLDSRSIVTESAVLEQLVSLAIVAPTTSFVNIVQLFSTRARASFGSSTTSPNPEELVVVQKAQLALAQALDAHAEHRGSLADAATDEPMGGASRKQTLLVELLQLFTETALLGGDRPNEVVIRALHGMVPILAAILAHEDINPQLEPTPELVYQFRNAWLVITLRHLGGGIGGAGENDPLTIVALKTPALVSDHLTGYLEQELEFNSLLRQTSLGAHSDNLRKDLVALAGSRAEIRGNLVRVAFVRTVLELEARRAAGGRVSMMLWYLANSAVAASPVAHALEAVAERVFIPFINYIKHASEENRLDTSATEEVRNLLVAVCHRRKPVRAVAHDYIERLAATFPELFGRPDVVVTQLEILSLLARSCEGELEDVYQPQYTFASPLAGVTLDMSDSYPLREHVLTTNYARTRRILNSVQELMPQTLSYVLLRYLSAVDSTGADSLGKSVALDFARGDNSLSRVRHDASGTFVRVLTAQSSAAHRRSLGAVLAELEASYGAISHGGPPPSMATLHSLVYDAGAYAVHGSESWAEILKYIVLVPFAVGTRAALVHATQVWAWVMSERPDLEAHVMAYIAHGWGRSAATRTGIYSAELVHKNALLRRTDMSKFNRAEVVQEQRRAEELLAGHAAVLRLVRARLAGSQASSGPTVLACLRLVQVLVDTSSLLSTHVLARELRCEIILFALRVINASRTDALIEYRVRLAIIRLGLDWFAVTPEWSFGGSIKRARNELALLREVQNALRGATLRAHALTTSFTVGHPSVVIRSSQLVASGVSLGQAVGHISDALLLLGTFVSSEISRLSVWLNPVPEGGVSDVRPPKITPELITLAWRSDPRLAVQLTARASGRTVELRNALGTLISTEPSRAVKCAAALPILLDGGRASDAGHWLMYWAPVSPLDALELFEPKYGGHSLVLQYAMRVLEQHPVDLVFFYIPQVVQALRFDEYGYVEEFIMRTSRLSQLFCHQIIWNMKANMYKDDEGEVPDSLKPTFDRMVDNIVAGLSGSAQEFYEREFSFFGEVTSISGKLKPYIKKSKPEKKAKIDEEMAKIRLDPGVYLPSNPDSVVVDLDRRSGRPLQSAAKAPFMATFKVRRIAAVSEDDDGNAEPRYETVWQSAIFKVGDDCRQDVLALQVIAQFKNIFMSIGLDVYVNPYRVTATAPGCGVIDVVPNATSRDEMGRAKINDLLAFFTDRYGPEDSSSFQRARINFIQSMAAYSIICHILQVRDRHNGNIMIDGEGHLVHIDFGFLFDIGPGGMRFEPYSFKLSHEMVAVMGGPDSPGFRMFEKLVVKCFLACRPYVREIVATCGLMLGTDLPSFKGPPTLDRLRDRFKPELSEREAAKHAQALVRDAYGNTRAVLYDFIQEKQNSIPYRR
ncbi:1-phosphatidylinositol 4-kinase [Malassezia cuniculi]|uniref:1-phosphatidylinositol 4-kinase n=1 Tax=Malassezia cuniculi TaxID=948313 RepID=A0AAF0EW51_9BASI|nr:1-phosphatidylinositol 4-kinase [Malassezia cuniculi]